MCLAIPGKISKIEGRKAFVNYQYKNTDGKLVSETRQAMIGEKGIEVGDYVMVQMGIVINKVNQQEAETSQKAWNV